MDDVTPTIGDPTGEPLMWTTKGNLPVKSLRLEASSKWVPGEWVAVSKKWFLGDEMVREDGDQVILKGLDSAVEQHSFGG